jgi:hypothetical protein
MHLLSDDLDVPAALRHRQSLELLLEARAYYESCPEPERAGARMLMEIARLNEEEARLAWMASLRAGNAS